MHNIIDNNEEIVNKIRSIYTTASVHHIRSLIAKHFIPSNDEKKKNAEISTPVKLVDEMLAKIPAEFWETPQKVLEPCCGKGNFVLGIFDKFYHGLEGKIPDEIERCRVITDCIYYCDITSLNVFITTELLKCHIQSYCGVEDVDFDFHSNTDDTLKLNLKEKWGLEEFDAVIGNPPYNNSQKNDGKKGGGDSLWNKFIELSLKIVFRNGYLLFVNPSGWRKPESERSKYCGLFKLMTKENQMLYLEIHDAKDGKKVFDCGTRYDWYVIQKRVPYINTIVKDENGFMQEINMLECNWLPNFNMTDIGKILIRNDDEHCKILFSVSTYETRKKWVQENQTEEYKYPLIHSTLKNNVVRYYFTNDNTKGHFGVSKVIFGESGVNTPIIDLEGKYGMTQHAMGIIVNDIEEANNVFKAITSEKFKDLLKSCSWSNFRIDWRLFNQFRKEFWREF
jgi:hypothetical protein